MADIFESFTEESPKDNMSSNASQSENSVEEGLTHKGSQIEAEKHHELAEDFPLREVKIGPLIFNPLVSLIGAGVLWGLAIYCILDNTAGAQLVEARDWISNSFTWLYIGTQEVWIVFLIYIYIYYGDRKLGADHEEPEFGDATYFMMIFCAGIGIGLYFFGVSEPLYHYVGANRYNAKPSATANELSQEAMNLTIFHWGVHGWVVYSFLACLLGFMSYRKGLPLTIRSCFYPVLGEHTWGWIGDAIDGISIVTIVAGVCTDLGLGAQQVLDGMLYIDLIDPSTVDTPESSKMASVIIIVAVTLIATVSVVSGLDRGIKFLSQFAFGLGCFLLAAVFLLDNSWFILNLLVQSTGYYLQWFLQLGFFTDAFAQLQPLEGQAIDPAESASPDWMAGWTIFYYGWWISWASFVGTFLARISRGRTIRQVFNYTMTIPVIYTIIWFGVFGGAGLRMHRRAEELQHLGLTQFGDELYFETAAGSGCFSIDESIHNVTGFEWDENVSPVCIGIGSQSWFDLLNQYKGVGKFLSVLSIIAMVVYFVTSSDSGSLVVDTLSANGREEHHVFQRIFWAFTEGAVAIALLVGSDEGSGLAALQAASIIAGLPYTIFLSIMTTCFWRALKYDKESETVEDDVHHNHMKSWNVFGNNQFKMPVHGGILDTFELVFGFGHIAPGRGAVVPSGETIWNFFLYLLAPFVGSVQLLARENGSQQDSDVVIGRLLGSKSLFNALFSLILAALFYTSVVMMIGSQVGLLPNFLSLGLAIFAVFATMVAYLRYMIRTKYDILGNFLEDFFCAMFLHPQVLSQLKIHVSDISE